MATPAFSIPILDGVYDRLIVPSLWGALFFVCRLGVLVAG
jgi:hypothetical protein